MLIRELGVENFRKFRQPMRVAGFSDGLNLVCEPNEAGKSTILEALRAALFERHGAKSQRIRSFKPHGDEVAPVIDVIFEVGGQTWTLRKRFLQSPSVMLEGRSERYQSDEAEEKLQTLLGFTRAGNSGADPDSRGALGLLWVEQGQSFVLDAPGQGARRTFEDVLAGEVGAVTGGRRTTAVVQAVEKSLAELLTATGKPTKRLAQAQDAVREAQANAVAARAELEQFEDTLTRLDSKRGDLRRVMRDLEDPEQRALLVQIGEDIVRAQAAAQTLRTAELAMREAAGARERAQERATQRQNDREDLASAIATSTLQTKAVEEQGVLLREAREAESKAARAVVLAREAVSIAEKARERTLQARLNAEHSRAGLAAHGRLERAEALAAKIETLAHLVNAEAMDAKAVEQLDRLDRKVLEARSALQAGSAILDVTLEDGAAGVTLNGEAIQGVVKTAISATLDVVIAGVGRMTVVPPASGETALARLKAAEQDLGGFLKKAGHADVAAARMAARAREDHQRDAKDLTERLARECPADTVLGIAAGLGALRGALSGKTRPEPQSADPTELRKAAEAAETEYQAARTEEQKSVGRREAALEALQKAQLKDAELAGLTRQAAAEVDRLTVLLARAQSTDRKSVV